MKTAERPIGDSGDEPVLHRIVVDVIDVALEVGVVTDGMFPIAAPFSRFAILLAERVGAGARPREKADLNQLQRDA